MSKPTMIPPLTAKRIEVQEPRDVLYELTDPATPGLRLRVLPSGIKVFRWHVVSEGKQRVITIGRWSMTKEDGYVTLAEARMWMEKLKHAHRMGTLAAVEAELAAATKPKTKREAPVTDALTVRALAADFMKLMERRRKRPEVMELILRVHIVPALGDLAVEAVTPKDCRRLVESIVERGHRSAASSVLQSLRQLFRFAIGRDELKMNPAQYLDGSALGVESNSCKRFLSAAEIPVFWHGLDKAIAAEMRPQNKMSVNMALTLKLLLVTAVRSGELLKARWEHVDFDAATWVVPVENQKLTLKASRTAKPWVVPLSSLALELLHELKALAGTSPWVASSPRLDGEHIADKVMSRVMTRLQQTVVQLAEPSVTPHDLRRTARTHLGETLRVPPHIAELCLNHKLGGIIAVYDVGTYLDERRAAMEKWGEYIRRLVAPGTTNVVPLVANS